MSTGSTAPTRAPTRPATKYDEITYIEVMTKDLKVMDATAITFCRDNNMPIVVFDMSAPGALQAILRGERVGTIIQGSTRMRDHACPPVGTLVRVIEETLLEAIDKMEKAVEHVQIQFTTVRTGRAAPALVEKLMVEYYGSMVPLQQLAGFQVPEARQLIVKPHDRASLGGHREGDPRQRPRRQPVQRRRRHPPQLPAAHRGAPQGVREGRQAHGGGRPGRRPQHPPRCPQAPRGRREGGEISADELERAEKEIEKITHEHVELIDKAFGRKEHELLEV